jgi:TetR/AcrR family transcriptional repressor of nem operon
LYQLVGTGVTIVHSKRAAIIKAASQLMGSSGYNGASLNDILQASGAGKGQFYYYFSSKRQLGLAVIDDCLDFFQRNLFNCIMEADAGAETKFDNMLRWMVDFHETRQAWPGCFFGNLALEMSEHDEEFRQKLQTVFALWAEKLRPILRAMLPTPVVSAAEVEKLALSIVAMLEGGILLMKNYHDIKILKNVAANIHFLVYAMQKEHGGHTCGQAK